MSYNVMDFVTVTTNEETGRTRVTVAPSELYPRTIAHICEILMMLPENWDRMGEHKRYAWAYQNEVTPAELPCIAFARTLPEAAWDLALKDRDTFDDLVDARDLEWRHDAMESALGWFMRSIRFAMDGQPYDITILRDMAYRL